MRRFHADHEGVMPDGFVLSLWKFDEAASAATYADSSYSGAYPLLLKGIGTTSATVGLFNSGREGAAELISSGMSLHLDASDDGSFDDAFGVALTIWRDISGNNRHADSDEHTNQTTRPKRVAAVQNGLAGVRFGESGKSGIAISAGKMEDITPRAEFTAYTVIKPLHVRNVSPSTLARDNDTVWTHGNGGRGLRLRASGAIDTPPFFAEHANLDAASNPDCSVAAVQLPGGLDEPVVIVTRLSGATLAAAANDGAEVTAASGMDETSLTFNPLLGLHASSFAAGTDYFDGYLLEWVCYLTSHAPAEIAQNVSALKTKWGI